MANSEHVKRLKGSVDIWNRWRHKTERVPQLNGARLAKLQAEDALLHWAKMNKADLRNADLSFALFIAAELCDSNFEGSSLVGANFFSADLSRASFKNATLHTAKFDGTILDGTDFSGAEFSRTIFANIDLSTVVGLDTCSHQGESTIDFQTLKRSGRLPLSFLRGIGLPDNLIDYIPSLMNEPIQYYSCFISYSTLNRDFTARVHADLQNSGVRCWFAPHDLPIGGKIWDEIDAAIRLREKVLLVLSEDSLKSDWVEDEVTKAFEEERRRGQTVLFPVRLDDAVMDTNEAWAAKLRRDRHIGDFTRWKEHDEYQKSFERVLRDLTVKKDR